MPSSDQQQARRIPNHRRTRPELNINTIRANDADAPLDPDLSTPLSPPPTSLQSPAIPTKSSQRSLKTFPHEKRHPPVSSKGKQAAAARQAVSRADFDNRNINARDRHRLDRERDRDTSWSKGANVENFLDLDNMSSPVDMSNKENDFLIDSFPDPHTRRESKTPSPHQPNVRDSHDLSLSPRNVTRDSLLGNMLLSLDQFSMGQMSGLPGAGVGGAGLARTMSGFGDPSSFRYYEEEEEGTRTMTSTTRPPRNTMHGSRGGHGYSYSSDYEAADDSSHMSSNYTRGRRSNSSSTGFQSNLGRINSMRETTSNQRAMPNAPGSRPLHSRGGKGSKSSSTNSIDPGYAQVLGSQRWTHGLGGPKRSSSFEIARGQSFGTGSQSAAELQSQQQQRQPWHIEFSNSFFAPASNNNINTNSSISSPFDYDVDDAAPTPTVPAGPRRLATMPSMPSFSRAEPMGEPLSPVRSVNLNLERKRSNKSSRSTNTAATRHSHHSSSRFNNGRDNAPPPPLPGPVPDLVDSAPAPHVGYEKAKEPVHAATPTSVVSQPPKDKPGFFRRMFGGSKNSVVAALDQSAASPSLTNSTVASPATATMNMANASPLSSFAPPPPPKSNSNPPSRQTNSSHGLQKKPSGFFRRRKKSVSVNNVDPPPLPTSLPPPILPPAELPLEPPPKRLDLLTPRPQPSPVTSLRKAMDPYLTGPGSSPGIVSPVYVNNVLPSGRHTTAEEINHASERHVPRGFSPDYEPDPKATIRSVSSEPKLHADSRKYVGPDARRPSTPTDDTSRPPYAYERAGSFLHDNSDSEDSSPRVTASASQPAMGSSQSRNLSPSGTTRTTLLTPIQTDLPLSSPSSNTTIRDKRLDRLTVDSISSDKTDRPSSLTLPIEGVRTDSSLKARASATSIPSLNIEESEPTSKVTTPKAENPLDEPEFVVGDPTEDDRAKAQKMFDGNEDFIPKEKAASWMGEEGPIRQRTLRAYMDLYDFTNKSVATSLRDVCNRLILRAETQQVDRVLVAFSKRWCDCNTNHGFKSIGMLPDSNLCAHVGLTDSYQTSFIRFATRLCFSIPTFTWPTSSPR